MSLLLTMFAASALCVGAQAVAPAPAGAMIDQEMGEKECNDNFGIWHWFSETCELNIGGGGGGGPSYGGVGGGGGGGSAAEDRWNEIGEKLAKAEGYAESQLKGLLAQLRERELMLRDLLEDSLSGSDRATCRRLREKINDLQEQWVLADNQQQGRHWFNRLRTSTQMRWLAMYKQSWRDRSCDNALPYRGW